MLLGLLGAFGAAVLYGAGTVLQSVGVRRATGAPSGLTLLQRVWRGRLYGLGLALDALGFVASVAALRSLPLFVVESAVASSVAVTALLAVLTLGTRLARAEVLALLATAAGLVLLAVSAAEGPSVQLGGRAPLVVLLVVAPVAVIGLLAARASGPGTVPVLAAVAGLGFGGVGVAARLLRVPSPLTGLLHDPLAWALVLYSVVALLAYGAALARGSVTTTAAVTFTVETVVPAAIGLALLGDRTRPGLAPVAVAGFVLALGGCVRLARHAD